MASHVHLPNYPVTQIFRARPSTRVAHPFVGPCGVATGLETRGRCTLPNCLGINRAYHQVFLSKTTCTARVATSARNEWLPATEELYARLRAQADREGWVQVKNTKTDPEPTPAAVNFSTIKTEKGHAMHFAFFIHKKQRKLLGVCQFGPETQGPEGIVHGGAAATIHDIITGYLSQATVSDAVITASFTLNLKSPLLLESTVLMEAHVDKIEGKKIYLKSSFKTPDGTKVYSECTTLYIDIKSKL